MVGPRVVALALLLTLLPVATRAEDPQPVSDFAQCGGHSEPGLGDVCERPDGSLAFFGEDGAWLGDSHGTDPLPDPAGHPAQDELAAAGPLAPTCVSATTPYRFVAIYARPTDRPDRYATMAPQIRSMIAMMNGFLAAEGAPHLRTVKFRFQCTGAVVDVLDLDLSRPSSTDTASSVFSEVASFVGGNPKVKPLVWYDGTEPSCGCGGVGLRYADDRASSMNLNNGAGSVPLTAIVYGYTGALGAAVMMHEAGHTMGAVQGSAPHTSDSDGGHCNDGEDIMCYADGGDRSSYNPSVCAVGRFDCNRDDYFHPAPAAGSYLATHWNLGSSLNRFVSVSVLDSDGDGVPDTRDALPFDANETADFDRDGIGDKADLDDDNDGFADLTETACRSQPRSATSKPRDRDADTVCDVRDNCAALANTNQTNLDGDPLGDACDPDDDGDRHNEAVVAPRKPDNCFAGNGTRSYNPGQADFDGDGLGDACDGDDDNDAVADGSDVCRLAADPLQNDTDGDGVGDACAPAGPSRLDRDGDGIADRRIGALGRQVPFDNCPTVANNGQADHDGDGRGDACDTDDDDDRLVDVRDPAPLDHAKWPFL